MFLAKNMDNSAEKLCNHSNSLPAETPQYLSVKFLEELPNLVLVSFSDCKKKLKNQPGPDFVSYYRLINRYFMSLGVHFQFVNKVFCKH